MAPLTVKAYAGGGAALLAFDVDEATRTDLAGFAVQCKPARNDAYWLTNRLNFKDPVVSETTPEQRVKIQTTTDKAPLQKFHWVHFPPNVVAGEYEYTTTAMLFKPGSEDKIEPGPSETVTVKLVDDVQDRFKLGFTRGYVSSQAYAERFHNDPLVPHPQTVDFATAPFKERYEWLGFGARKLVFDFLDEAVTGGGGGEARPFALRPHQPGLLRRPGQTRQRGR